MTSDNPTNAQANEAERERRKGTNECPPLKPSPIVSLLTTLLEFQACLSSLSRMPRVDFSLPIRQICKHLFYTHASSCCCRSALKTSNVPPHLFTSLSLFLFVFRLPKESDDFMARKEEKVID
jgi:hypothetical protein